MVGDKRYASESILVHEFGHAVMNIGMDKGQEQRVKDVRRNAALASAATFTLQHLPSLPLCLVCSFHAFVMSPILAVSDDGCQHTHLQRCTSSTLVPMPLLCTQQAFCAAKEDGIYDPGCYMMANADEYWAEAVQAWCASDFSTRADFHSIFQP